MMMTDSKHTPGPWKLLEVGENKRFCPADKDNQSILTIEEEGRALFACVYEEADARLIAAAPELLEALKNLAAAAAGGGPVSDEIIAAGYALAKAEAK